MLFTRSTFGFDVVVVIVCNSVSKVDILVQCHDISRRDVVVIGQYSALTGFKTNCIRAINQCIIVSTT